MKQRGKRAAACVLGSMMLLSAVPLSAAPVSAAEDINYAKALQAYKTLKKDFPLSNEAFEINKNIANMEEKLKK